MIFLINLTKKFRSYEIIEEIRGHWQKTYHAYWILSGGDGVGGAGGGGVGARSESGIGMVQKENL